MIVFPVQETSVKPAEERNAVIHNSKFDGYKLRSAPLHEDVESDSSYHSDTDYEQDIMEDRDQMLKYIQQFQPRNERERKKTRSGAESKYPYIQILKNMIRFHQEIFIHPFQASTVVVTKEREFKRGGREYHLIALECLDKFSSLDSQGYFSPILSVLRKLILLGVREREEASYMKSKKSHFDDDNDPKSSPVLAWLEDSLVKALETVLTTHFITTDIASVAKKLWSDLPELLHFFKISPQRCYLKYPTFGRNFSDIDKHAQNQVKILDDVGDLLQAVEKYNEIECLDTFGSDLSSIPEYVEMIPFPISIKIIRENYNRGEYDTLQKLFFDVHLMLINCLTYNPPDTQYYAHAKSMFGFLYTWMATECQATNVWKNGYNIQFEEHIVNRVLFERMGNLDKILSPKAKLMRDNVALQAVAFLTTLPQPIDHLEYLKRDFTLHEAPEKVTKYVLNALDRSLVHTVPLTHAINYSINYLFSCIELIGRYQLQAMESKEPRALLDQENLNQSTFLNIEGFLFGSPVEQYPLVKHQYWCIHVENDDLDSSWEEEREEGMIKHIVSESLGMIPVGRLLKSVNPFFNNEKPS